MEGGFGFSVVQGKVQDAYAKIRPESQKKIESKQEKRHFKKRYLFVSAVLATTLCTVLAVGVTQWNRGLSESLQVLKETEEKAFQSGHADGDLEFITSIVPVSDYHQLLPGKEIHITLGGLGVYGGKAEDVTADVDETWDFTWTLTGTEDIWEKGDLNVPLWDSGAVLKYVRFSPIFFKIDMEFPKEETEIGESTDAEGNPVASHVYRDAPVPCALKMTDGTIYYYIFDGGSEGYHGGEDVYSCEYQLDRIIDPDQVKSILYIKEQPEGEGTVPEKNSTRWRFNSQIKMSVILHRVGAKFEEMTGDAVSDHQKRYN